MCAGIWVRFCDMRVGYMCVLCTVEWWKEKKRDWLCKCVSAGVWDLFVGIRGRKIEGGNGEDGGRQ